MDAEGLQGPASGDLHKDLKPVPVTVCRPSWSEMLHYHPLPTKSNITSTRTKELVIDLWRDKKDINPLTINGDYTERLTDFRFLGVHLEEG